MEFVLKLMNMAHIVHPLQSLNIYLFWVYEVKGQGQGHSVINCYY